MHYSMIDGTNSRFCRDDGMRQKTRFQPVAVGALGLN